MENTILDKVRVHKLLQTNSPDPSLEENHVRSWSKYPGPTWPGPLLRAWNWDEWGCDQLDESKQMTARASGATLSTYESRKSALSKHADWWIYKDTPFISFVSSASSLETFLTRRFNDHAKKITVINPNVRIARGVPVINMEAEMKYYGVQDPYGNGYIYYKDEFLCLWEVSPDEIVGCWKWRDLDRDRDWYGNIVLPAFVEHNERFLGEMERREFGMAKVFGDLTKECISEISDSEDSLGSRRSQVL